ncbi:MAG: ABC transporter substrate-binding protein [Candidatus Binatia bacterium]
MKLRIKNSILSAFSFWALLLYSNPAVSGPLDPYVEAAKKEGSVRLGVTLRKTSHGKPSGEKYLQAFQKRYPFLKVDFKRIGGARERERVLSEMSAGVINFDVATVSETMVPTVIDAKLARIVDWKKLGVPKFMAHPKNVGVSLRTPVYGIAYNREKIPDEVAKTFTWETCTDPKWKGKTATDDRPRHLNVLYRNEGWGREKTLDYAKRWAANKPSLEPSRSTGAQKLSVGSYYMICGMPRRQVEELQVYAGAKTIGIVYPEPVPVGIGDLIYVAEKAKHPNAGILFLAWTATEEAQTILDNVDFSGHPAYENNDINKVIKGKKTVYASWEDTAKSDDILAEILQAMGFPVVR